MLFDAQNLIIVIAAFLNAFLGFVILLRNSKNKSNRWFGYFVLSLVAWSITMILFRSASTTTNSVFWAIVLYEAAIFIPATFLFFALFFPDGRTKLNKFLITSIWIPPIVLLFLTYKIGFIISGVIDTGIGEKIINWGPYYFVYNIYFIVYFSIVFVSLFIKFFRSSGILRTQIKFVLFGTFMPSILANTSNLLLPTFGIFQFNWLGQILTFIMVLFIGYAIAKHHLLNIKVIATEIFALLIPLTLLVDTFLSETKLEIALKGGLFVFVSFFSVLLVRSVIQEVKSKERMEKMAESLHQANIELQRLDKAKSEFISIASHQLRTPLTAIRGFISMILEGDYGKIDGTVRDKLEKTMQSAQRLVTLVEDLLTLSRIEGGKLKYNWTQVNFSNLVKSVFEELEPQARLKKIEYRIEIENQNIILLGDENKLRQVIMNLIDNAIKYTLKGSVVCSLERESGQAIFRVKDTGIGIDKSDIHFLFAKFSRGDRSPKLWTEGLGLGLYVARIMLQQHQGTIGADSEGAGRGSTFWVKIPILSKGQNNF